MMKKCSISTTFILVLSSMLIAACGPAPNEDKSSSSWSPTEQTEASNNEYVNHDSEHQDTDESDTTNSVDTPPEDSESTDAPDHQDTHSPDANNTTVDPEPVDEYTGPDLSGRWAQKIVTSSISEVPIVGEVRTTATGLLLVEMEREDAGWLVKTKTCDVQLDGESTIVETVLPDALIESLEIIERPAILEPNGNGYRYFQPQSYEIRGAKLNDPINDALPTSANDSRVFDQDNDGKPGITVRVTGLVDGEIYLVQRSWDELEGELTEQGDLDGLVTWGDEQVILDSDNALLKNQPDSYPDPVAANSYFRTTRISEDAECDAIIREQSTLFAR